MCARTPGDRDERQIAVALEYDASSTAPRVAASGQGEMARRIIETAQKHGVPLVQDAALAAALRYVPLQADIPVELYGAVAAILAYVYQLENELNGVP